MVEGCLSVPGRRGHVTRAEWARVKAFDRKGNAFEIEGDGLLGRALQHELDHLDGIVYTEVMELFLTDEELDFGEEE